jgi:hypothetical protein
VAQEKALQMAGGDLRRGISYNERSVGTFCQNPCGSRTLTRAGIQAPPCLNLPTFPERLEPKPS